MGKGEGEEEGGAFNRIAAPGADAMVQDLAPLKSGGTWRRSPFFVVSMRETWPALYLSSRSALRYASCYWQQRLRGAKRATQLRAAALSTAGRCTANSPSACVSYTAQTVKLYYPNPTTTMTLSRDRREDDVAPGRGYRWRRLLARLASPL